MRMTGDASTRALAMAAAGVLATGLAACGGGGSSGSSAATTSAPATQAAATSASTTAATTTGQSAPAAGTTGPGTALAVGQTATVPFRPVSESTGKPKFTLKVTVTAIEKGSLNDFNGIKLDAGQKASTPFYVKAKIENASPGDASAKDENPSIQIQGVDNTGETQQSVTFLGEFPRCEDKQPPKPLSQGKSFETCLVFLVPGGIQKAAYTGAEEYITSPVTWK